jgi:hypothetical protein
MYYVIGQPFLPMTRYSVFACTGMLEMALILILHDPCGLQLKVCNHKIKPCPIGNWTKSNSLNLSALQGLCVHTSQQMCSATAATTWQTTSTVCADAWHGKDSFNSHMHASHCVCIQILESKQPQCMQPSIQAFIQMM